MKIICSTRVLRLFRSGTGMSLDKHPGGVLVESGARLMQQSDVREVRTADREVTHLDRSVGLFPRMATVDEVRDMFVVAQAPGDVLDLRFLRGPLERNSGRG